MKFLFALIFSLAVGCAHNTRSQDAISKVKQNVEVLPSFKASQYSDIYFSAQPPLDSFEKLKEKGFASIVNLRQPIEKGYKAKDEELQVQKVGLNYINIPVKGDEKLTDEKISEITSAIVKNRKQGKTLVHCSSGNRAALWAGGHFYKDHGVSKEAAALIAIKLGLDKEKPKETLNNYLKSK